MERYLEPIQDAHVAETIQHKSIDERPLKLYRLDDGSHEVVVERNGNIQKLNIADAGVSRKKDGKHPVELVGIDEGVKIVNISNATPVAVRKGENDNVIHLEKQSSVIIRDDCVVELGIDVEIRVNIVHNVNDDLDGKEYEKEGDTEVPVAGHVDAIVEGVDLAADNNEVMKCRKQLQRLHDIIIERPVNDEGYTELKQDINEILTRLDNRIENPMRDGEKLDDEFRKEIEIITQNVEVLYI